MCVTVTHSLLGGVFLHTTDRAAVAPSGTAEGTVHNGLKTDHLYVKLPLS